MIYSKAISVILCSLCLAYSAHSEELVWHVSNNGSNSNDGTFEKPFKTIEYALERSKSKDKERHIEIASGNYYNVGIVLGEKDSGLHINGTSGTNLYGGQLISTWKQEGQYFTADLKNVKDRTWDFRSLIVNGSKRDRARFPENGALTHENVFDVKWRSSSAGGWARKPTETELHQLKYQTGDLSENFVAENAELTIYHEWDETLVGLSKHDPKNRILHFSITPMHPPGAFAERNPNAQTFVIWNTIEGMTRPGQWYLDRSNEKLVYWPFEGETTDDITAIAASKKHVINFEDGAKNITLRGFKVSSSTTSLIRGGYGALAFSGAIQGNNIQNITLDSLSVIDVGGWGIRMTGKNIKISNCEIANAGAGAIGYKGENVIVENNELHDVGTIYPSAVGIFGSGTNNIVRSNHIYNMPYCGINNVGDNSIVENNTIYNIKTFMQDGGAIYLFAHKNTVVRGNAVFGNVEKPITVYAYYLDERCDNCTIENNLALNTIVPVQAHMTTNCTYQNNVFIDKGLQSIRYANSDNLSFDKNLLIANAIVFMGPSTEETNTVIEESDSVMKTYSGATGITSMNYNVFDTKMHTINMQKLIQYDLVKEYEVSELENNLFESANLQYDAKDGFSFGVESKAHLFKIAPITLDCPNIDLYLSKDSLQQPFSLSE